MKPPLDGVTVVSLEQAVAAPFATRQLADFGARVIKVERPGEGDFARHYDATVNGMSSHFVWLNRSKESLTLNVKEPEAETIVARLIERADVFVQNLAPGAAERLALGAARLRERYPRLIICNISGYGSQGPYKNKKAYDLLIQSESGLLSITGTPETPSKVGISIADIAAGMYAYSSILMALFAREQTGQGTVIDVSMLDALGEWMGYAAYYTKYGGVAPARTGASHAAIAPYGPFESGDGKAIYIGIQNEREWSSFCAIVLEQPGLACDARFDSNTNRVSNRAALTRFIEEVFNRLAAVRIVERLEAAGIAFARMNTVQEFVDLPQLAARGRWRTVDSPVGPLTALVPPADIEGIEPVMERIPGVGEDTDRILSELGFDAAAIAAWRLRRVI